MNSKKEEVINLINNFIEHGTLVDIHYDVTTDRPIPDFTYTMPSVMVKQYTTEYLNLSLKVIKEY